MLPVKIKFDSIPFAVAVAVILMIGALMFPMRTSLGQGIGEFVVTGWRGVYDPVSQSYHLRIEYADGTYHETAMKPLSLNLFTKHVDRETWTTPLDDTAALSAAYQKDPQGLEKALGTYHNVPGFMTPFAQAPVAYSVSFLKALAAKNINLGKFGGPDLPPSAIATRSLSKYNLQIDTLSDANTLSQCRPGETPPEWARFGLKAPAKA